jgi:hypothetical protein
VTVVKSSPSPTVEARLPTSAPTVGDAGETSAVHHFGIVAEANFTAATSTLARLMGRHAAKVAFNGLDATIVKDIATAIITAAALTYILESIVW